MGEVWKAHDTNLGREVAIKTLPPEFAANSDYLLRFRREAQAASALNHPNICVVHDLGEHNGQLFIVMELLRGETLRERLARGPLPIDEALDLIMHLADGLDAAHGQVSSIETSSPRTSSSPIAARLSFWTSAWLRSRTLHRTTRRRWALPQRAR
jgi:serine/threonine protein kinase